jgi:hypothetical protein
MAIKQRREGPDDPHVLFQQMGRPPGSIKNDRCALRRSLREGKQIGVDHVSMGERHAVRIALVDLQRDILHKFG